MMDNLRIAKQLLRLAKALAAEDGKIDLVVLDGNVSEVDGSEFGQRFKERTARKREDMDYVEMMGNSATLSDFERFEEFLKDRGLDVDDVFSGDDAEFQQLMNQCFNG